MPRHTTIVVSIEVDDALLRAIWPAIKPAGDTPEPSFRAMRQILRQDLIAALERRLLSLRLSTQGTERSPSDGAR